MATETQESAKLTQLAHENPDEIEVAAGREREQLEGWIPALASDGEIREALEKVYGAKELLRELEANEPR